MLNEIKLSLFFDVKILMKIILKKLDKIFISNERKLTENGDIIAIKYIKTVNKLKNIH